MPPVVSSTQIFQRKYVLIHMFFSMIVTIIGRGSLSSNRAGYECLKPRENGRDYSCRKAMINHTDKTIPYRLSPAELENLRLLRKKMGPSSSSLETDEERDTSQEINTWNSDPDRLARKEHKRSS